ATPATLLKKLKEPSACPFQVLHFMGHGLAPDNFGGGALVLLDESGGSHSVRTSDFADQIGDSKKELRLIVLNACHTREPGLSSELQRVTGASNCLISKGFSTVVGMSTVINDNSAVIFSRPFYEHIANGTSVEEAMCSARLELLNLPQNSSDW